MDAAVKPTPYMDLQVQPIGQEPVAARDVFTASSVSNDGMYSAYKF
jgi:hypothetical protein